jgi:hypothetical protein
MKELTLTSLLMMICAMAFSQNTICKNQLDTAQVIAKAKRHHAYWNKDSSSPSTISFHAQSCTWTVVSNKSKHSNRGRCKNTNGCTVRISVELTIDANTKKVKMRTKKKTYYPNYE